MTVCEINANRLRKAFENSIEPQVKALDLEFPCLTNEQVDLLMKPIKDLIDSDLFKSIPLRARILTGVQRTVDLANRQK